MIPPTSIDGTDITGATIDGTDVTEITVDGDTVFSAKTLPIAYSNLVAWYPFDSATYGGGNADDVTAIVGGSGDDTAYDGTFDSSATTPTYQPSGGVTDINAGANSGAFEFDGSNDFIRLPTNGFDWSNKSISLWSNREATGNSRIAGARDGDAVTLKVDNFFGFEDNGSFGFVDPGSTPENQWVHFCFTNDGTTIELFVDGTSQGTDSWPGPVTTVPDLFIGASNDIEDNAVKFHYDGLIDDFRIYNKRLSSSEVNQIYNNTQP